MRSGRDARGGDRAEAGGGGESMALGRSSGDGRRGGSITRRTLLQRAVGHGVAASTMGALDLLALVPSRAGAAGKPKLPQIQFQIEKYLPPAIKEGGVQARLGPLYTVFATITLQRTPTTADQAALTQALATVECSYPFSPSGVFMTLAYGIPYFQRLPGGLGGPLVAAHMPRLKGETERYVLEEAVPGPTDVSPQNPGVSKQRFDVPVQIESNDMLLTLRSDSSQNIDDVLQWLTGQSTSLAGRQVGDSGLGGLIAFSSRRLMFTQQGLPRRTPTKRRCPAKPKAWPASTASITSVTRPRCSAPAGHRTTSLCTSARMDQAMTRSMSPTALHSRSSTSASSCRPPSSSARCAAARHRRTSPSNTPCRLRTSASSASSPPPGGRTSSCPRVAAVPFRSSSSPERRSRRRPADLQ